MESVVRTYLEKNYRMSIDDYFDGCMLDKQTKKEVSIDTIIGEVNKVFSLTKEVSYDIVKKWWDDKEIPYIKGEMEGTLPKYRSYIPSNINGQYNPYVN